MWFNIFVFGAVAMVVGLFVGVIAWFAFAPKKAVQAAQQMVPLVQPQPMQPIVRYEGQRLGDTELDRKLLRVQRVLQQKYEAKADAAAIAEAYELLGEDS